MSASIFEPTITLDGVVTFLSVVGGGIVYLMKSNTKIDRVGTQINEFAERMKAVEAEMKKLTDITVSLARYDERITSITQRVNMMDKRWEELRHGQGLVVNEDR